MGQTDKQNGAAGEEEVVYIGYCLLYLLNLTCLPSIKCFFFSHKLSVNGEISRSCVQTAAKSWQVEALHTGIDTGTTMLRLTRKEY